MEKALIKTKEKKINIFQRIRIKRFQKNMYKDNFDFQKYKDAPIFIKRDNIIINILISNIRVLDINTKEKEKFYLEIPQDIIMDKLDHEPSFLYEFSIEKQMEFAMLKPSIVRFKEDQVNILKKASELKQYTFWKMYPDFQKEILEDMRKEGSLDDELPNIIKYLKNKEMFIVEQPNLLSNLDIEEQFKYVYTDRKYLQYVSENEQLSFIQKNEEYIPFASDKVSEELIKLDIRNLAKTNAEFQYKMVQRYPKAYESINDQVKKEIWSNPNNKESIKAALRLIETDDNFSKNIIGNDFEILSESNYGDISIMKGSTLETELINFLNNCGAIETRKFFEKSKILSSHSTLLEINKTLHGILGGEKIIFGREDYSTFQRRIIRNLDMTQIKELIDLDVNYILPYLGTYDSNERSNMWQLTDEGKNSSKAKCQELLNEIYGEELATQLKDCIEKIYSLDMHERMNEYPESRKDVIQVRIKSEKNYTNYFKILFNKNIIQNNSIDEIKAYFSQINLYEKPTEEFYKLIKNAYGEKAYEIVKSRPGLNVHTINSFEDFDKQIIENFGESFVHNLLNYNIRDHQELMGIIKDKGKLENFKTYYEILSKIQGYNTETIQKAISEYNYFDKLLQHIKYVELTEEQYENLIPVLCSSDNQFNINTLEELQNYEEISSETIKQRIKDANGDLKKVKKIISGDILGFRKQNSCVRDYGYMIGEVTALYNISLEKEEYRTLYTKDEIRMLECILFIEKEDNPEILSELALNLINEKRIQNPIIMHKAVEKIMDHQTELFNSSLLTIEKMKELCKQEEGKENPKITKEILKNGLTKYVLKGIDFKFMPQNSFGMGLKDLIQYEGHMGCNNICTRLISQDTIKEQGYVMKLDYIYTSIKEAGGIQSFANSDANTDHVARRVHGVGGHKTKIDYNIIENSNLHGYSNEVAQNRNIKKNENVNNESMGGKILPDAYCGELSDLTQEDIEIMKKYNIPIIYIDAQYYTEQVQKENTSENKIYER